MLRACRTLLVVLVSAFLAFQVCAGITVNVESENFSCTLPDGWHQTQLKGAVFCAVPDTPDGRVFSIGMEGTGFAPIPREPSQYSDFERTFWRSYDSKLEKYSHCQISARSFAIIGNLPFRVIDMVREDPSNPYKTVRLRILVTVGDQKIFELASLNHGGTPENDFELEQTMTSFAFIKPPSPPLLQPLLIHLNDIAGLPLLLAGIGGLVYLWMARHRRSIPIKRIETVAVILMGLLNLNCFFIAGMTSYAGGWSVFLGICLVYLFNKISRERRKDGDVALAPPSLRTLGNRFLVLIFSSFLGIVIFNLMDWSFLSSHPMMLIILDVAAIGTIGIIFGLIWKRQASQARRSEGTSPPTP